MFHINHTNTYALVYSCTNAAFLKCLHIFCRNLELVPLICPGITDGRFVRSKGIPVIGFSPMNNTPMLLHNNDEYLDQHIFLKGIDIFEKIIKDLASLE